MLDITFYLQDEEEAEIVESLAGGEAFEVEFSDRDGRTYESVGLRRDRIIVLHFEQWSNGSRYNYENKNNYNSR